MKSENNTPRFLFVLSAILLAAMSRLLPHPPNFTPISAIALFGGACFSDKRFAFVIPMLAMFLSDCIIGFHNTIIYVYASFIAITFIGFYLRNHAKAANIILASFISSILFFIVTNAGVWAAGGFQLGAGGLITTLLAGVPFYNNEILGSFFLNTIVGDLFYTGLLFGSFYLVKNKFPSLA